MYNFIGIFFSPILVENRTTNTRNDFSDLNHERCNIYKSVYNKPATVSVAAGYYVGVTFDQLGNAHEANNYTTAGPSQPGPSSRINDHDLLATCQRYRSQQGMSGLFLHLPPMHPCLPRFFAPIPGAPMSYRENRALF